MLDNVYLETFVVTLRTHHDFERFDAGLTDSEIDAVERKFGFSFPRDLRTVLQFALPVGKQFPKFCGVARMKN